MSGRIRSFPPVIDGNSGLLVLGSMPGVQSLQLGQYYGNPRNYFWRVLYGLSGDTPDESYEARLDYAHRKGVALWDVIGSCERPGSLDANIREAVPNDLPGLLREYPNLRCLAFNGGKSFETFRRHFGRDPAFGAVRLIRLPSTSPIPTAAMRTLEDRLEAWRAIAPYLKRD